MSKSLLLYGGFYSDTLYNDLWQYNIYSNMWDKISTEITPPGFKGHRVLLYSGGFAIYGGSTWTSTNLTEIDSTNYQEEGSSISYSTGILLN